MPIARNAIPLLLAGLLLAVAPAAALAQGQILSVPSPAAPPVAPPIDPQQVIGGQNAIDRGYQVRPAPASPSPALRPPLAPGPVYLGASPARRASTRRAHPRVRSTRPRTTLPRSTIMAPETSPRRAGRRR